MVGRPSCTYSSSRCGARQHLAHAEPPEPTVNTTTAVPSGPVNSHVPAASSAIDQDRAIARGGEAIFGDEGPPWLDPQATSRSGDKVTGTHGSLFLHGFIQAVHWPLGSRAPSSDEPRAPLASRNPRPANDSGDQSSFAPTTPSAPTTPPGSVRSRSSRIVARMLSICWLARVSPARFERSSGSRERS